MACNSCAGGSEGNPNNLNPGQLVASTGQPLLSTTVDITRSLPPGQFAPVLRYYYLNAQQRRAANANQPRLTKHF